MKKGGAVMELLMPSVLLVFAMSCFLGLSNLVGASGKVLEWTANPSWRAYLAVIALLAAVVLLLYMRKYHSA